MFKTIVPHKEEPSRPIPDMWKEYCEMLISTGRPGVKRLLNWMQSDMGNGTFNFVNAPAHDHGSYPGGLLEHSMHVYNRLTMLVAHEQALLPPEERMNEQESKEYLNSCTIVSLLHDVCKTGFYVEEWRAQKVYSENGTKEDAAGKYDWKSVRVFKVNDTHKFGHGASSVEIVERFLGIHGLTDEEKYAITYHMGNFESERETGDVYNRYPLATLLHMADIAATYLDERECDAAIDTFWERLTAFAKPVKSAPQK